MKGKLKILHLEDSVSDAKLVDRVLRKGNLDYEILLVQTKETFVAALDEFIPDLILSDHSLPSFNSHEALSIYTDRQLKIPFILITSNVSEEFAVNVIKRGAEDYILKDRLERLPTAINNALEKYRLEKNNQSQLFDLIKNEKHYRALIENGGDVLVVFTEEGRPKYVSPSIQKVLGYTEEEALNLNLFDVLHPDDKEATVERWAMALRNPGLALSGHEGRMKNKKGEWVWLEATMTNMLQDPSINGIVDNFRDITERKLATLQLVKTQLFNKSILSSLDAHIAVIDQNGSIISVNKAWDDFSISNGAESGSLTSSGSNYFDVCEKAIAGGSKIAGEALKGLKSVLNKDLEVFKLEYPCHSPTEKRWFVLNATSFGGDEKCLVVSHQNVTDLKLAEEKLLLNELMFRGLIENSADGMAILTAEGKPRYVSPSIRNVLGYSEFEGMQLDLMGLAHQDDVALLSEIMQKAMANPGIAIKGGPTRMLHKDGNWRLVEGVLTNMLHDPSINGIVDNFRDITERVHAENAIKTSEERYRSFFENSMDGILLTITDGDIFAANPAACKMFQMTEQEICATGRFGLVDNSDPRVAIGIKERQLKGKVKVEVTLVRKDGTKFPGEITSAIFRDFSGLQRTSMIVRDISERKLAEQKIIHANRLYSFISQINQTIVHVKDDQTLFSEACRIAVQVGGFKMAWIGVPASEEKIIRLVASHGPTPEQQEFFREYSYEPGGPIEKVIKGRDYVTIANISAEVKVRLSELADKAGFNSVIALPIKNGKKLQAIMNIYSTELDFFDEQEISLLTKAVEDISFALEVFEKERLSQHAEKLMRESQTKLLEAQAIAKIGSWETNMKTFEVIWSPETYRIFDVELNEKINHNAFLSFIHPQDIDRVDQAFRESVNSSVPNSIEHRIITARGIEKYVVEHWQIVLNSDGLPVKAVGATQDITARKTAEDKLRDTESQYKQIVETAQEGIWLVNKEGKTTFVNRKMCQILEYSEKEVMESELFEFMDDEGKQMAIDALDNERLGIASHADFKYITKSGREVWTTVTASPFFDSEGNYSGSLAMISDVTEKKALQELLDKAITLSRIGTYEIDLVTNQLYWSPMTKDIHEVPEDFVPDLSTGINFYKEGTSRDAITQAVGLAINKQIPFDLELEITTAKGDARWVRAIGETECRDGQCIRLYGSFQDIDKVKNAELEVLKAYEEKDDIIESIDDAFFAVGRNWVVTYWNNRAEKVLNRERKDVLDRNLWEIYPELVGTPMWTHYHDALTDNRAHHFEAHYATMNKWFDISVYPSNKGLSVFFKDITGRKMSEVKLFDMNQNLQKYAEELLISNKGLEQFSYIISHNLRAPVANILGLTEILESGTNDRETTDILMNDLVTNVKRLDEVILDLNGILKVKSVVNELKEKVSLKELLTTIQQSIQNLVEQENLTIDVSGVELDEFYSLRSYMHSIFLNLVTNTIKYRHPDRVSLVEIGSREEDGMLTITYKDNGRGIDMKKNQENVFGLYKRFHRDIEGKGMGLYMVKTQTEILGGKVSLKSEVDHGVEFTFKFPLHEKHDDLVFP